MDRYLLRASSVLLSLLVVSCHKDEEKSIDNSRPVYAVDLFCLNHVSTEWNVDQVGAGAKSWQDLTISLDWGFEGERDDVSYDYYSERIGDSEHETDYHKYHWREIYRKIGEVREKGWDAFPYCREWADARVLSEVVVQADKALFGLEPGTNLAGHFTVASFIIENRAKTSRYTVYSYPEFDALGVFSEENPPSSLSDAFRVGTASIPRCNIKLKDMPEDVYDEISFSFSLPLSGYSVSSYSANGIENPEVIEKTLQGAVTIHFRKE